MTHSRAENSVWAVMAAVMTAIMVPRSFDQSEDLAVGGMGWNAAHYTAKAASRGKT
ncbi:MAG: hypothetical protein ACKVLN_00600 [Rhodobacterales bacterium]|jgi:hypothetical protein|tara:strand:- start:449 stop:616 length:168 start_codon:yes stop_codon:yes gene_type:complete